jgi:hypothetical protein
VSGLGMTLTWPCPGDTITAYTEIIGKKDTSKKDTGILYQRHWGTNQNGEIVTEFERTLLMMRKSHLLAEKGYKEGGIEICQMF